MMKYPHRKTIRLNDELLKGLGQFCDKYRINESDYIRHCVEEKLVSDLVKSQSFQPTIGFLVKDRIGSICGKTLKGVLNIVLL